MGLKRCSKAVLDIDDIFSQYYRSAFKHAGSWTARARYARHFLLWKRRERILLKRFGVLTVCSDDDRRYLGDNARIHSVPNGYGMTPTEPARAPAHTPRIGFIGTLKYAPNREGVRWFSERVWPKIKQAHPSVRLRLVGADSESVASKLGADVDGLGWLADASSEIATWSLTIVPVQIGGGTRVKIAEAFSRKCPVVATSWGAFGYDVKSGNELLLADKPGEFTQACLSLLRDTRLAEQMAERAWNKYINCWTWSAIASNVKAAVDHCLSLSGNRLAKQKNKPEPAMSVD
jgi:glycosyltransferase involved in cell wall biosynthesis